jgi:hypothetical protein
MHNQRKNLCIASDNEEIRDSPNLNISSRNDETDDKQSQWFAPTEIALALEYENAPITDITHLLNTH